MHRKGAQDAKRAKQFAKIAREITVATKLGGEDASSNPRLRGALVAARSANMPKDNVDRAIKKALGSDDSAAFEDIRYEGYGIGGIAVIVEALTDNRNRTASDVRSTFVKNAGNLGETGSVSFGFDHVGVIYLDKTQHDFNQVFETAIELGADDVQDYDDIIEIIVSREGFPSLRDAYADKQGVLEAKIIWKPQNTMELNDDQAKTLLKMIDILEDLDDVQHVYHNAIIDA